MILFDKKRSSLATPDPGLMREANTPRGELLSVHINVDYPAKPAVLRNLSLDMQPGEVLGLIGHSGCGKSTLALAILRLLGAKGACARGEVLFRGRDLMKLSEREMRRARGRDIGLVLQSPLSSLNPALRIGTQLREAWRAHAVSPREDCTPYLLQALESVSLPADEMFLKRRPSELSVGQGQRVLIAMALLHQPALLIADEPTSALDLITQSEILQLFARLNRELGAGILYISHDLLSVASLCHRIAILHEGTIIEAGPAEEIFLAPREPYTRKLVAALPSVPSFVRV